MEGMLNYFVPEDGDSSDHLNVVPLPRGVDQLRLQHVKKVASALSLSLSLSFACNVAPSRPMPQALMLLWVLLLCQAFPLPGEFHFRFKTAFEGTYGTDRAPRSSA
jgi:hypothetical protein